MTRVLGSEIFFFLVNPLKLFRLFFYFFLFPLRSVSESGVCTDFGWDLLVYLKGLFAHRCFLTSDPPRARAVCDGRALGACGLGAVQGAVGGRGGARARR